MRYAHHLTKLLFAALAVLAIAGCSVPETDADKVKSIISSAALEAATADRMFQEAMTVLDSVKAGRPLYQAAEEIAKRAETMRYNTANLARILEERCSTVKTPKARMELERGVRGIYEINSTRSAWLTEIAAGMNVADAARLRAITEKYAGDMSKIGDAGIVTVGHLVAAKEAVGLPGELPEFQ